ncbi:ribosomal maturation YjgA family protein [Mucilaginibacter segetis]|uniref:DUF2809 domain-containing protein n=1 Tax=Mucilaginibacter segetis TaxID=2793071 RepID=A0A934UNE5_9SPHI|nr:DUF2809 domain-containing protein [Mucilaginibacter segetis]MBK0380708.1 DUF2809 domain-containing protein [Mucilaginibacter segetis]
MDSNVLTFNKKYAWFALVLLATEVWIAACIHDDLLRPYGGDLLVVIMLYCMVKTFIKKDARSIAFSVLLFAYAIEISQYYNLVEVLDWGNNNLARIIIGTTFQWGDILSYTLGIILVLAYERLAWSLSNY